jgi:dihydroorotase
LDQSRHEVPIHIYSSAAITYGLEGKRLTNFEELYHAGAVTFTDDGRTVMDPKLLLDAFTIAKKLGVPISSHCEDHNLVNGGAIHLGIVSEKLGTVGIHPLGEELIIARDILFAEAVGTSLHIQHVSTARGVELIREAKRRGVRVTAEATPHHFSITEEYVLQCGTLAKVNPPLRSQDDVEAIVNGLIDGTLDAIASDHAPHTQEEKSRPLESAPFGMVGLETSVGLAFTYLVHTGKMTAEEVIAKMTINPAKIMNLPHGKLEIDTPADITIIDPNRKWVVDAEEFVSKSKNTPFNGMELTGKTVLTMVNGRIIYEDHNRNTC